MSVESELDTEKIVVSDSDLSPPTGLLSQRPNIARWARLRSWSVVFGAALAMGASVGLYVRFVRLDVADFKRTER